MPKTLTTIICVTVLLTNSAFAAGGRGKSGQPANGSSPGQDFVALQKAFIAAQERGDTEYVKNAVADDFTGIESNGDTTDREEFIHGGEGEKAGQPPILYDFRVIQLGEDCAVVTYNAVFPANHIDLYQRRSSMWVNENGRWRLKFQQITLNLWSAHDVD